MAASNPNQMEAAQAQVQEVVGVMRNNIDKVVLIIVVMIMRNNIDIRFSLWCDYGVFLGWLFITVSFIHWKIVSATPDDDIDCL